MVVIILICNIEFEIKLKHVFRLVLACPTRLWSYSLIVTKWVYFRVSFARPETHSLIISGVVAQLYLKKVHERA